MQAVHAAWSTKTVDCFVSTAHGSGSIAAAAAGAPAGPAGSSPVHGRVNPSSSIIIYCRLAISINITSPRACARVGISWVATGVAAISIAVQAIISLWTNVVDGIISVRVEAVITAVAHTVVITVISVRALPMIVTCAFEKEEWAGVG